MREAEHSKLKEAMDQIMEEWRKPDFKRQRIERDNIEDYFVSAESEAQKLLEGIPITKT